MTKPADNLQKVMVWDVSTRLFHWTLVLLMILQWWTAEQTATMTWHMWGGYIVLALVLFRLIWGFTGSETARFSNFVRGPSAVIAYFQALLRGQTPHYHGHNPMGAGSIIALLVLLFIQSVSGLFANDDIMIEGPLYSWVSKSTSNWMTTIHKVNFNLLLAFIALHIGAVFFYLLVKGENLVRPMFTGNKHLPPQHATPAPRIANQWSALAILGVVGFGIWLLVR